MCIALTRHRPSLMPLSRSAVLHLRRDVDEAAAAGDVEPEFLAVAFHVLPDSGREQPVAPAEHEAHSPAKLATTVSIITPSDQPIALVTYHFQFLACGHDPYTYLRAPIRTPATPVTDTPSCARPVALIYHR